MYSFKLVNTSTQCMDSDQFMQQYTTLHHLHTTVHITAYNTLHNITWHHATLHDTTIHLTKHTHTHHNSTLHNYIKEYCINHFHHLKQFRHSGRNTSEWKWKHLNTLTYLQDIRMLKCVRTGIMKVEGHELHAENWVAKWGDFDNVTECQHLITHNVHYS